MKSSARAWTILSFDSRFFSINERAPHLSRTPLKSLPRRAKWDAIIRPASAEISTAKTLRKISPN